MDEPVWTNSMCNKLGRLSQGWEKHAGTDTIEFILHKVKQKDTMEITCKPKYNTRSSTKRVNHVTKFKNAPNMFKVDVAERVKTHMGKEYLARREPKKYTITVEPIVNHINNKTIRKY